MTHAETLEEDILRVVNGSWLPLSLEDIWDRLTDNGIAVPILYLSKVAKLLVQIEHLKEKEIESMIKYVPYSFWSRFKSIWLVPMVRKSVKIKMAEHNKSWQTKTFLVLGLMMIISGGSGFAEIPSGSDMDLSPVQLAPSVPPISTSRPSFTDAVTTVPQGSIQAENGVTYTNNRGGSYSWTVPETLLRLGLTENTELRYTVPNYIYNGDNQPGSLASNFGDTSVALSHHQALPGKVDMALIPILNLPTGANKVSSNSLDPQFRLVVGKAWTPKWFISSHLDTRWNTRNDASADVVFNPTFINYYSFTKKLTGFLEYSGFYPTQGKSTQYLQSGALYLLTPRQQLDARIAIGLNKNSPNILVGFGYSFRVDGLFGKSRDYASFSKLRR